MKHPYYPIIYVRGYAMTQTAVEDTVADPYMGFNIGATKVRQRYTGKVVRHIFESPLVRLMKEMDYQDVYLDGEEVPNDTRPPDRSVFIYRYYETVSKELGTGERPEIEDYAQGLKELLDRMEQQYCQVDGEPDEQLKKDFRVYLIAHSMGGLICRCLLQNISPRDPRVDKVFTYATPHGGIDLRGVGNVPDFVRWANIDNFNEKRMRRYLNLNKSDRVQSLKSRFPSERFFCLIGTNHRDYGSARMAVGPMSDGLVKIKNAYVDKAPRAFVHRSHSGHYGVVNSEEGYQNLCRFFYGDMRVDALLDVEELTLPDAVRKEKEKGKKIRASYHVEAVGRVRGARWDLHRRVVDEGSAVFLDYDKVVKGGKPLFLASLFLSRGARVNKRRQSLGFSLDLRVLVPEYIVNGRWFLKDHHEGGYIFRDKLNLEATYRSSDGWRLKFGWDSKTPNLTKKVAEKTSSRDGGARFRIPVESATKSPPAIKAVLRLDARPWNR